MQLQVRLWGMDSSGKPFSRTARTIEISGNGARLDGISFLKPDEVIGVQYGEQKARFQVAWVGAVGTEEEGQIGIVSVEPGRCLWSQAVQDKGGDGELGSGSSVTEDAAPVEAPSTASAVAEPDRRRYPRFPCIGRVLLRKEGTDGFTTAKLTDIGLGGCYAETFSPLALETPVELVIEADGVEVRGSGLVRTVHASMGNGIAFTKLTADDWGRLNELIARVSSSILDAGPVHGMEDVGARIPPVLEVLLTLLEKKGVLTREEFRCELGRAGPRSGR